MVRHLLWYQIYYYHGMIFIMVSNIFIMVWHLLWYQIHYLLWYGIYCGNRYIYYGLVFIMVLDRMYIMVWY